MKEKIENMDFGPLVKEEEKLIDDHTFIDGEELDATAQKEGILHENEEDFRDEQDIEAKIKFKSFSKSFIKKWNDPKDPTFAIIPLTKDRYMKGQNINSSMYSAAKEMEYIIAHFDEPMSDIKTGDAINAAMRLHCISECYYNTHRGKQYYSSSQKRKAAAKTLRDQTADFIKSLMTEEEEADIQKDPETDIIPDKAQIKEIQDNMTKARKAIDAFNKKTGQDSCAMETEEIIRDKLAIYRVYDQEIRMYKKYVPQKDWGRRRSQLIEEYENLLRMEKLLDRKVQYESRKTETIRGEIEKTINEEDEREQKEKLQKDVDEGLSKEQLAGINAIDKWLVRNFQNGGILGSVVSSLKNFHGDFVASILQKTKRERLFLYYLVSSDKYKSPSAADVGISQTIYVPDLAAFKDKMLSMKINVFYRFTGKYTYMNKLSEASIALMDYTEEIRAMSDLRKDVMDERKKKNGKEPEDENLTEEEKLIKERLRPYLDLYEKLDDYRTILVGGKNARGDNKKQIEEEAKAMAASIEQQFQELRKSDMEFVEKYQHRKYVNVTETTKAGSMAGLIGTVPGKLGGVMNMTRKKMFFNLLGGWSWGMDDKQWETFNLWTGSISGSFTALTGIMGTIGAIYSLVTCGKEMSKEEFGGKILEVARGASTIATGAATIAETVIAGGVTLASKSTSVPVLSGVTAAIDVGMAITKTVSVAKQTAHSKKAQDYFNKKHNKQTPIELVEVEKTEVEKKKEKRKEKFEKNMLALSKDVISRDKTAAIYQGIKATAGVVGAMVFLPGVGVAAVVGGIVAIAASIHDILKVGALRMGMFDRYFGMDDLTDRVVQMKKRNAIDPSCHLYDNVEALKKSLRRRVAAAAGFCDMNAAADYIAGKFSRFIHGALFGPEEDRVKGAEKEAYIDLLKSFNLPYNEAKQIPSQNVIYRKMIAS